MSRPALHLAVPADLRFISETGGRIREFLTAAAIGGLTAYQIELSIVEVIRSVVRRRSPDTQDASISVNIVLTANSIHITIEDPGISITRPGSNDPLTESALGIGIADSVMDEIHHKAVRGRSVVELLKRVSVPAC